MTVTVIKSTDAGAPAITGQAGGAIAALDFALVSGLGWTKPFSGTNKAVYRPAAGTRLFMQVAQDASLGQTTDKPAFLGYETMSNVDTGTNRFPSAAQITTTLTVSQSTAATARSWVVIGDAATAYIFINHNSGTLRNGYWSSAMFGDFSSFKPTTDDWKCLLVGSGTSYQQNLHRAGHVAEVCEGHYMARGHTGLGTSVQVGKHSDTAKGSQSYPNTLGAGGLVFPNAIDGGIYMAPVYVHNTGNVYGKLRGVWAPLHNTVTNWPFVSLDTFEGTGTLAGKTFMFIVGSSGDSGIFVEVSNTWSA